MEDETNKPILKVGDKIRIKSKEWFDSQYKSNREDIEPPEEYNRPFFDFMEQYCGNICTIRNIYTNNVIKFNENDEDWEDWMFDLVDEEEKEEEPQYKVGDKVVINSIDWYNANKDGFGSVVIDGSSTHFIESMKEYCGEVCTIKESFKQDNGIYYYLEELGYCWQSWMFSSAKESTKEESKKRRPFFRREPQTGDTIKSPYFNGIIIGENDDKDTFLILTTPDFDKHWLDKDDITEIDGYGRYLYHIDTCECNLDIRADKLRKMLLSEDGTLSIHEFTIGDEIMTIEGCRGAVLDISLENKDILIVYTAGYKRARLPYTYITSIISHGKYSNFIDENEPSLTIRIHKFIDKSEQLKVSKASTSDKDSNSQSDSSKFDLSKVIYKSRRIK